MTDEEITTTSARSQQEIENEEEGKEPKSFQEKVYTLIHMSGGWFPIVISLALIGITFLFIFKYPEKAEVGFLFMTTSVLPIVFGHQAWKTRQVVDSSSAEVNRVSVATTRTAANKVISSMAGTVAETVANKVEDKVAEVLNKSSVVIKPQDQTKPTDKSEAVNTGDKAGGANRC